MCVWEAGQAKTKYPKLSGLVDAPILHAVVLRQGIHPRHAAKRGQGPLRDPPELHKCESGIPSSANVDAKARAILFKREMQFRWIGFSTIVLGQVGTGTLIWVLSSFQVPFVRPRKRWTKPLIG